MTSEILEKAAALVRTMIADIPTRALRDMAPVFPFWAEDIAQALQDERKAAISACQNVVDELAFDYQFSKDQMRVLREAADLIAKLKGDAS